MDLAQSTEQSESATAGLEGAEELAQKLTGAVQDLVRDLDDTRYRAESLSAERSALKDRVFRLEAEVNTKNDVSREVYQSLVTSLPAEELRQLRDSTAALAVEPDRLSLLLNVAERAQQLADVLDSYTRARTLVENV